MRSSEALLYVEYSNVISRIMGYQNLKVGLSFCLSPLHLLFRRLRAVFTSPLLPKNKGAYMTALVAFSWAGAVMWAAGGAIYMMTSLPCDWAGAVMRKLLAHAKKPSDRPTERPTK